ncbi:MAG: hypothetical protein KQI81_16145 [Deltaproteobacteria bacterium]|nr:hypothetical protein [Deltaproteobacteria bacterium]
MMNEQLSWLTPFSQQVAPGLSWRSGGHGKKEHKKPDGPVKIGKPYHYRDGGARSEALALSITV